MKKIQTQTGKLSRTTFKALRASVFLKSPFTFRAMYVYHAQTGLPADHSGNHGPACFQGNRSLIDMEDDKP